MVWAKYSLFVDLTLRAMLIWVPRRTRSGRRGQCTEVKAAIPVESPVRAQASETRSYLGTNRRLNSRYLETPMLFFGYDLFSS